MPTLREVFDFQYNLPTHLVLLLVLFAVTVAHLVIAAIADVMSGYVIGIIVPVICMAFCCLRMLPVAKKIAVFYDGTMALELIAYVLYLLLNTASLVYLSTTNGMVIRTDIRGDQWDFTKLAVRIRIACTTLELALEALLAYKLLSAMLHLRWFRLGLDLLLQEGEAEGAGSRMAAGLSIVRRLDRLYDDIRELQSWIAASPMHRD